MAAVTIYGDFGTQENKVSHCFHCFPIYLPWSDGTGCHDLFSERWVLRQLFHSPFSPFIKRLFSSSSLSAVRVVTSAYMRLLIFVLEILIPAYDSSSPAFCMMYSAYMINSRVTTYSLDVLLSQFCSMFQVTAFWPAYRFLRRKVRWSGIPISFRIFHSLLWSTQSKTLHNQ